MNCCNFDSIRKHKEGGKTLGLAISFDAFSAIIPAICIDHHKNAIR